MFLIEDLSKNMQRVITLTSEEENIDNVGDEEIVPQGNLLNQSVEEEMKTSYINYAMSVIVPDTS